LSRLYSSKFSSLLALGEKEKALSCLDSFYRQIDKSDAPDKLNSLRDMGEVLLRVKLPEQAKLNADRLANDVREFPEASMQVGLEIFATAQYAEALSLEKRSEESLKFCLEAMRQLIANKYVNGGHRAELIAKIFHAAGSQVAEVIPLAQEDLSVNASVYNEEADGLSRKKVLENVEKINLALAKAKPDSKGSKLPNPK
ncbi:MAG: hypothetical protein K2X81_19195, partial [Candidatus Obscuribacterales bacterium]|nr:hypothetical protein [Candidatus Obscuribacterales bacterium]